MDELTPMDSSYQEMPPEQTQQPDYYGTGRMPVQQKSHTPLIAMLLILLIAFNLLTVVVFLSLWRGGKEQQTPVPPENDGEKLPSVPNTQGEAADGDEVSDALTHGGQTDTLSDREIYEKLQKSMVTVTVSTEEDTHTATGVVLTESGYLLTAAHAVSSALSLTATLPDETVCTASYVGADAASDLAVLRIEADGLTPAEFGDSDALAAGDALLAFADPFGQSLGGTMLRVMISAVNEGVTLGGTQTRILQISSTMTSGASGGILANTAGQIVAVGMQSVNGFVSNESVPEIGFALPSNEAVGLIDDLMRYGCVSGRAALGMEVAELDGPQRIYWGLPEGVIVSRISTDSSAYSAGIRPGDVLLRIGEIDTQSVADYQEVFNRYGAGDTVRIILYRGGNTYQAEVTLEQAGE